MERKPLETTKESAAEPRNAATRETRTTGRLRITPAGFGLIRVGEEDVFVGAGALSDALDEDQVEVELTGRGERGPKGRVVRVLARQTRNLTGVIQENLFVADDPRIARPLRVDASDPTTRPSSMVVGVEVLATVDPQLPEVRVVREFGLRGAPRVEEDALLWREGLSEAFPDDVLADAGTAAKSVYSEADARTDLRGVSFVTVDPATAEDHDDALFAHRGREGAVRAFVAIADVSAFVRDGGALDLEARRRGTSLYFPSRVVPMLPPVLSSDAASLLPGVDRAAVVLEIRFDAALTVTGSRLVPALIRSRAKLTYEDAAEVLEARGAGGRSEARAHAEALVVLDELAQRLREQRRARGAIAVETPAVQIDVDPVSGLPTRIAHAPSSPWLARAHQLVEELMLLANETVAAILKQRGADALFRVHSAPSDERALRIVEAARCQGIELDASLTLDAAALRDVIKNIPDPKVRDELAAMFLDAMPGALYAARRHDHFALASKNYVHFTSPIRRYADLTIHRAICAALLGRQISGSIDPEVVNATQQRARSIQREIGDLYAALLMQSRIGEVFTGTVLRALKQQVLVALDEPSVVVRCPLPEKAVAEGAEVRVRVAGVSIARRAIEAVLLPGPRG